MLPVQYEYVVCRCLPGPDPGTFEASFRINTMSRDAAIEWKGKFQELSKTTMRVKKTKKALGKKVLTSVEFRCQHKTRTNMQTQKKSSKNTDCPATLKLRVYTTKVKKEANVMQDSRSADPHRLVHPTEICLKYLHNHPLDKALKHRDVSELTRTKLSELLIQGLTPAAALELHKKDMYNKDPENYHINIADRSECPDSSYVYRLAYKLRKDRMEAKEDWISQLQDFIDGINGTKRHTKIHRLKSIQEAVNKKLKIAQSKRNRKLKGTQGRKRKPKAATTPDTSFSNDVDACMQRPEESCRQMQDPIRKPNECQQVQDLACAPNVWQQMQESVHTPNVWQQMQDSVRTPNVWQQMQDSVRTPNVWQQMQDCVRTPNIWQQMQDSVRTPNIWQQMQESVRTPNVWQQVQESVRTPNTWQQMQAPPHKSNEYQQTQEPVCASNVTQQIQEPLRTQNFCQQNQVPVRKPAKHEQPHDLVNKPNECHQPQALINKPIECHQPQALINKPNECQQLQEPVNKINDCQQTQSPVNKANETPQAPESICMAVTDDDQIVIAICTPMMRGVHRLVQGSGELVVCDTSGSVEKDQCRIFLLLTNSSVGGLPLGALIVTSESEETLAAAVKLYRGMLDETCFYGRGERGPAVILSNDSFKEMSALSSIFPESKVMTCVFHILQEFWRYVWDVKNGVKREDRPVIFHLFKNIIFASTPYQLQLDYERALSNNCVERYRNVVNYIKQIFERRTKWAICLYQDLPSCSNENNKFSETAMKILKDKFLPRIKSFNVQYVVDFFSSRMEQHYKDRCLDLANNRLDNVQKNRFLLAKAAKPEDITQVSLTEYEVRSSTISLSYRVDMALELCSCPDGSNGAPCSHQAGIAAKYGYHLFSSIPEVDAEGRHVLLKVAEECRPAKNPTKKEPEPSKEVVAAQDNLQRIFLHLKEKLSAEPGSYLPAMKSFVENYWNINSDAGRTNALRTFGQYREPKPEPPKKRRRILKTPQKKPQKAPKRNPPRNSQRNAQKNAQKNPQKNTRKRKRNEKKIETLTTREFPENSTTSRPFQAVDLDQLEVDEDQLDQC